MGFFLEEPATEGEVSSTEFPALGVTMEILRWSLHKADPH